MPNDIDLRASRRRHRRHVRPRIGACPTSRRARRPRRLRGEIGRERRAGRPRDGGCWHCRRRRTQGGRLPYRAEITGNLGGLDALINNASSLGPTPLALLADTECEELQHALDVNVLGPFRLTKALFGALAQSAREGRGAVVINISSDAAVNPYPGWGAYGASKAALSHMTSIWGEEARAEGVTFLSLDPGDMDTPLHALGRSRRRSGDAEAPRRRRERDRRLPARRAWRSRARSPSLRRAHDRRQPDRPAIRQAPGRRRGRRASASAARRAGVDVPAGRPRRRQ